MCTILFAYDAHPRWWLILAANRDEFYERPTRDAGFWEDDRNILAGRDLKGNGTWMGVTRTGRFAAVTNFRDPGSVVANAPSRGALVTNLLKDTRPPLEGLRELSTRGNQFNGFNLIAGDGKTLSYYSNRGGAPEELGPGLYGVSNRLLDTPWPKVQKGKKGLSDLISGSGEVETEEILALLSDRERPDDNLLPDTGVGLEWERLLSSIFINGEIYGTRSSYLLLMGRDGELRFTERSFSTGNAGPKRHKTREFAFSIDKLTS